LRKFEYTRMEKAAESLGWQVSSYDNSYDFGKYSPAGQDFHVSVTAKNLEELSDELKEYYDNFDVSEETYLWLDNTGHGKNGAPYDMKDLYDDMEECENMFFELANAIAMLVK